MCISVPMQVLEIRNEPGEAATGTVCYAGARREVSLATVPDVQVGDYVLVQYGLAMSRLDPDDALLTIELLKELDDLWSEEEI